ncbi:MAG: sigma-70 family RNA polymerase sigma factor [Pseudomonadales bacterium]|nr:sigma-70 family RNA polymerase sigma factor [Pseudomonadales bacterium]
MHAVAEKRDEQAFANLFDVFAPKVKAYSLAQQPGAVMVADELVQEVMLKIWNKAHLFSAGKASVSTWIFTMARNARIDYLRKNGRFVSEIDPEDIYNQQVDESQDLFSAVQQKQLQASIQQSISLLPNEQAQVLAKVYMEGKSHQQVADELSMPLGTVKSRVRLALGKLEVMMRKMQ